MSFEALGEQFSSVMAGNSGRSALQTDSRYWEGKGWGIDEAHRLATIHHALSQNPHLDHARLSEEDLIPNAEIADPSLDYYGHEGALSALDAVETETNVSPLAREWHRSRLPAHQQKDW